MNSSAKQALFVLVVSLSIFWAFKPKKDKSANQEKDNKEKLKKPKESDFDFSDPIMEDAYKSLCAYVDAYNDGVSQKELDELNEEIARLLDMQVVRVSKDTLAVEDLKGQQLLTAKV